MYCQLCDKIITHYIAKINIYFTDYRKYFYKNNKKEKLTRDLSFLSDRYYFYDIGTASSERRTD